MRWHTGADEVQVHLLEKIISFERTDGGARLHCTTADGFEVPVTVDVQGPQVLRLGLYPPGIPVPRQYPMLVDQARSPVPFTIDDEGGCIRIRTSGLAIEFQRQPWGFGVLDPAGHLVCRADRSDLDIAGALKAPPFGYYTSIDGPGTGSVGSLSLWPDEHLYGLGEKFTALDKRGQRIVGWSVDALGVGTEKSYKNIPFYMSTRGYGVFVNATHRTTYDLGYPSLMSCTVSVAGAPLDLFLIVDRSLKAILDQYTRLTGKPPVPPKWSFGLWMAGYGYRSQEEVIAECREFRRRDIPCDVINLDPVWLRIDQWCDFTWDRTNYPDPAAMIEELRSIGIKVCLWEQPYVANTSDMYREGRERGYFVQREDGSVYEIQMPFRLFPPRGPIDWRAIESNPLTPPCGVVDFTNPDAARWYQEKHRPLLEMGVAVFKTDMGEYAPADGVYHSGARGDEVHNVYPLLYNRTVFEATRQFGSSRPMVWSRTAYAGSQRYPISWGGDPDCTFASMACQLRGGLSFGLSGGAFWSHDIPGTGPTAITPELYIRWAQFGLFSSHARCHGLQPREPWHYGSKVEAVFRTYAKLRYRLLPYLYSCAHESSRTGLPVLRPMVLEFQDDPNCHDMDLQYCLGREFLVAPICDEGEERVVYLPEGRWVDYWSKRVYTGPMNLRYAAPLEVLPLLVRGDSIVPMGPEMSFVDQAPWDPLTLDIYLFERASFTLRDDGESTRLSCSREHEVIRCTMESAGGPARTYLLVLNGITALGSVLLDGQPMARCPSEPELAPLAEGWWATTDRTLVKLQADRKFALEMRP